MPNEAFLRATDDLPDTQFEKAISDFLLEQKLLGEFLIWIEKWKSIHQKGA